MTEINQNPHLLENSLREALEKNEWEVTSCQEYKNDLEMATRNLQSFRNRLRVDVMVPLGPHALMPGHLYHTNEVLIGKPSGLFIESTTSEALQVVQQRIVEADKRLKDLEVEANFFRSKLEYPQNKGVFSQEDQQEIIEEYDEASEEQWRVLHRQRVREAKLKERDERNKQEKRDDDEEFSEIMNKLEELELMEELQDEFNSIVEAPPVDLTGLVNFTQRPRVRYELDSFSSDQPAIASHVNGEAKENNPEMPKCDDPTQEATQHSAHKKKEKRKSLQFSEDLEKVKLIHKTDRPNTLITAYDPSTTIQLKFKHSPVEFRPPPKSDSEVITSPVDIYKKYVHCMKHWTAPSTPDDLPRSILKKTTHTIPVDRQAKLLGADGDDGQMEDLKHAEVDPVVTPTTTIYEQVVGEVTERNVANAVGPAVGGGAGNPPKHVSRFKSMRS